MKIVAIIQARMGSTRLPGKMTQLLAGKPIIWHVINRVKQAKLIDKVVLATSADKNNEVLIKKAKEYGIEAFAGDENDVLDRYYQAARKFRADIIVRITGDCPLIDPKVIDEVITLFKNKGVDYASNVYPPTYPDGLDVEVFSSAALEKAWKEAKLKSEREHVTPYIAKNKASFRYTNLTNDEDLSSLRLTVDEEEDLVFLNKLLDKVGSENYDLNTLAKVIRENPKLLEINKKFSRSEGYIKSLKEDEIVRGKGQVLYKRAKEIIPGGTQLLSKRPELYLPNHWPAYYQKAKGVEVLDLDGNKLVDLGEMGIGSCILGYADDNVNSAVKKAIEQGSMSTLNCPEEVELAELLLKLNPWAGMVRFARTGGEAMVVAVRIARAYSKKDKIAFCGYHGWHDWYLATNLADEKNLDKHLLTGLKPLGVPKGLKGTMFPFNYNKLEELKEILKKEDIGIIVMEPMRDHLPENDFLKEIRKLADKKNIVLVFDEITSAWRQNIGGVHQLFNVAPDICIYGKAISNGFPMAAIVGKKEVMDVAQESFISSTYWTEKIGPTAALATIKKMQDKNVLAHLRKIGELIIEGWKRLAEKHNTNILIEGIPAMPTISFKGEDSETIRTIFIQEMLKRRFLVSSRVFVSYAHTERHVEEYLKKADEVLDMIKKAIKTNTLNNLLEGPVAHSGFERLT